jgi:patatin-like phospholipase
MDAPSGTLETPRSDVVLSARRDPLRRWHRSGVILGALVLAACSTVPRTPYTAAEQAAAIPNMADVRVFADVSQSRFIKGLCPHFFAAPDRAAEPAYLALSGGGNGGAYGAGVLNGWTASGTRPEFVLVSGVSTGAMIAPFAFLGPSYDSLLREFYTSGIAESLVTSPHLEGLLFGSGLSGNERLRELVARYVDGPMLARIAAEYAKGRCLAVVTTDLDAQRAVVWDMGRIASYGSPAALKLFRDVLIASAAVPVVFPQVFIDAEANGRTFREMHVDGGLTAPVFTLPAAFLLSNVRPKRPVPLNIYILINDEIYPDFQVVPESTVAIAGRTVSAMLKAQTRSVVFRTYEFAHANGLGFNVTYIGADGPHCGAGFDTACMRQLYEYGYEEARSGRLWQTRPPTPVPPVVAQP